MISCKQMAEKLEFAAIRARNELDIPTEALMKAVSIEAKTFIGNYQDGWKPLAESTLDGWHGHPGKIELGYAPPDNPLLREGDMRESIEGAAETTGYGAQGVCASKSKIALYQEIGTEKIPPRPFLATAMMRAQPAAEIVFGQFAMTLLER